MVLVKEFSISGKLTLLFDSKNSLLWLSNNFFFESIILPSFYFFLLKKGIKFLFTTKFFFNSFFSNFKRAYFNLFYFNFLKLKIKGLGYRGKKIYNKFFKFFFSSTNFFYFYVPKSIFFRVKKKQILCVSNDYKTLKIIFHHMFLLNKISVYRVRGLTQPKQIINLKIGKQNV